MRGTAPHLREFVLSNMWPSACLGLHQDKRTGCLMCGIVGYVGDQEATPILMGGLRRLEYRGYDSAGVAVANGGPAEVRRSSGKLINLERLLLARELHGKMGIGHTRWATHGGPSDRNAHPHKVGTTAVVHNGIIENHVELRQRLMQSGRRFSSDTDTEVVAHLIDEARADGATDLVEAVRQAVAQARGSYALCVLADDDKERLVAAKNASPLVIGVGDGESFVASDVPAFLDHTRRVVFLDDGDIADVTRAGVRVIAQDGRNVNRAAETVTWDAAQAEKGGYPHFMLKEIYEQPRAVADTLRGRLLVEEGDAHLDGCELHPRVIRRVLLLACGTSYHAGLVGKFMIESTARLPCEVDLASEFRYRDPVIGPGDLVIAISQSGETADTLAAVREARARGARVLAISNVVGSAIVRGRCGVVHPRGAGDRRGVDQGLHVPAGRVGSRRHPSGPPGRRRTPHARLRIGQRLGRRTSRHVRGARRLPRHRRLRQIGGGALPSKRRLVPGTGTQPPHRPRRGTETEGGFLSSRGGIRRG
jgi:glutamine---fructose-6-phosphate transaminase (isomerizing)